jgi:hypothetical protein
LKINNVEPKLKNKIKKSRFKEEENAQRGKGIDLLRGKKYSNFTPIPYRNGHRPHSQQSPPSDPPSSFPLSADLVPYAGVEDW